MIRTYSRKPQVCHFIEGALGLCRLCLGPAVDGAPIFADEGVSPLALRVMICVGLEIKNEDCLPNLICHACCKELEHYYAFRKKCEVSYQKLKSHLQAARIRQALETSTEDNIVAKDIDVSQDENMNINELGLIMDETGYIKVMEFEDAPTFIINDVRSECFKVEEVNSQEARNENFNVETVNSREVRNEYFKLETVNTQELCTQSESFKVETANSKKVRNENFKLETVKKQELCSRSESFKAETANSKKDRNENFQVETVNGQEVESECFTIEAVNSQQVRNENFELETANSREVRNENFEQETVNSREVRSGSFNVQPQHDIQEVRNESFKVEAVNSQEDINKKNTVEEVNSQEVTSKRSKVETVKTRKRPTHTMDPEQLSSIITSILVKIGVLIDNGGGQLTCLRDIAQIQLETGDGGLVQMELVEEELLDTKTKEPAKQETQSLITPPHGALDATAKDPNTKKNPRVKGGPWRCAECARTLTSQSALRRHARTHSGERPFPCPQCGRRFAQKEVMMRHRHVHNEVRPHKCGMCAKSFTQRNALLAHERSHVPPADRPLTLHRCPHCPKLFLHASGLSRHMAGHGGRVYECGACGRQFADRSAVLRHVRRARHGGGGGDTAEPGGGADDNEQEGTAIQEEAAK